MTLRKGNLRGWGGEGLKTKEPSVEGYGYFLEPHIVKIRVFFRFNFAEETQKKKLQRIV